MAIGWAVGGAADLDSIDSPPFRQFLNVTTLVPQHRSVRYRPYESSGNYSANAGCRVAPYGSSSLQLAWRPLVPHASDCSATC
jgi:hypothetical protein